MKCKYNLDEIIDFMEDPFIGEEKKEFFSHVQHCITCRNNYDILIKTQELLSNPSKRSININSKILSSIDANRYLKDRKHFNMLHLYYSNSHKLNFAALIVLCISTLFTLYINFASVKYVLYEGVNYIKEYINLQEITTEDLNDDIKSENTPAHIDVIDKGKAMKINYTSYITGGTIGRIGPGVEYEQIIELPYGKLVYLIGRYNTNDGLWFLAKLLPNFSAENLIDETTINQPEFWIKSNTIDPLTEREISFDTEFYPGDITQYNYIVLDKGINDIELKQMPDEKSTGACIVRPGNLISVIKKDSDWSLVIKFNVSTMESVASIGWIKNSDYTAYSETITVIKPTQGFLVKPFEIYEKPGVISAMPKSMIKNIISPVNIIKNEGRWTYVSSGFNGLAFYVETEKIKYSFTSNEINNIVNPDIDKTELLKKIQEDILNNWKNIRLHALDYPDMSINLTNEQRTALAGKLTEITEIFKFDGGTLPEREAPYPFYTLEFLNDSGNSIFSSDYSRQYGIYAPSYNSYSLVVAGENKLYLNLHGRSEYYGQNSYSIPIKFITLNKEFNDYIKTILPVKQSTDKLSFNYLFNATKVSVIYKSSIEPYQTSEVVGELEQQINKCIRRTLLYIDISTNSKQKPSEGKYIGEFDFSFTDGSMQKVIIYDNYVEYNGLYYKYNDYMNNSLLLPGGLIPSLFAAYF